MTRTENGLKPIREMNDEELLIHFGVQGMRWGVIRKANALAKGESKSSTKGPTRKYNSKLTYLLPTGVTKTEAAKLLSTASGASKLIEDAIEEIDEEEEEEEEGKEESKSKAAAPKKSAAEIKAEKENKRLKKIIRLGEAIKGMEEERDKEQAQFKTQVAAEWTKIRAQFSKGATQDQVQSNRDKIEQLRTESAKKKDEWDKSIKDVKEKLDKAKGKDDKASHEALLEHYGVPGMKWGVRKKIRRAASKIGKANTEAEARLLDSLGMKNMAAFTRANPSRITRNKGLEKDVKAKMNTLNSPKNKKRRKVGAALVVSALLVNRGLKFYG